MDFEKAYCLYRLNQLSEAESILNNIVEKSSREKDLLAQVVSYLLYILSAGISSCNTICSILFLAFEVMDITDLDFLCIDLIKAQLGFEDLQLSNTY